MQIPMHKIDANKLFIKWRDIEIVPGSVEHAHRHDYFQLMFLQEVKGQHEIDFENYEASPKSLHFVGKGRVHNVNYSPEVQGGVLLFPEAIFSGSENDLTLLASFTFFKNGSYPILNLAEEEFKSIALLVERIKESLQADSFDLSKYLLFALLIQVRALYNKTQGRDPQKKEARELIQFAQLLKINSRTWSALEDYTSEIGITNSRLNTLCKNQYGKTALQMLHDRKLLEAKRMLVYTDKQVKEIAYDCGFEDVAYFNRFFKKHIQCTPLTFRNNH